jgi:hypothetical protein
MQDQTLDSRPRISCGKFRTNIQSGREIWLIDAAATRKRVLPPGPMSGVPMFYSLQHVLKRVEASGVSTHCVFNALPITSFH